MLNGNKEIKPFAPKPRMAVAKRDLPPANQTCRAAQEIAKNFMNKIIYRNVYYISYYFLCRPAGLVCRRQVRAFCANLAKPFIYLSFNT